MGVSTIIRLVMGCKFQVKNFDAKVSRSGEIGRRRRPLGVCAWRFAGTKEKRL